MNNNIYELAKNLLRFNEVSLKGVSPEQRKALETYNKQNKVCYMMDVLVRKKDVPTLGKSQKIIKQYDITSLDDFKKLYPKAEEMARLSNARVYIDVNPRRFVDIQAKMNEYIAKYVQGGQYHALRNVFAKAYGQSNTFGKKRWIIDIDSDVKPVQDKHIKAIEQKISSLRNDNTLIKYRTKNGVHIVSEGFNSKEFMEYVNTNTLFEGIEVGIQKNAQALLFYS